MSGRQLRLPSKLEIVRMLCRGARRISSQEWIDAAEEEIVELLGRYKRMAKSPAWLQQSSLDCPAHTRLRNSEEIRSFGNLIGKAVRGWVVVFGFLHRVGVLCSATIRGKKSGFVHVAKLPLVTNCFLVARLGGGRSSWENPSADQNSPGSPILIPRTPRLSFKTASYSSPASS